MPTTSPFGLSGVASNDLRSPGGLGNMLQKQVGDETEDEKLRRKLGLSATQTGGSMAVQSLFGGWNGRSY